MKKMTREGWLFLALARGRKMSWVPHGLEFLGQCKANFNCRCFVRLVFGYVFPLKGPEEVKKGMLCKINGQGPERINDKARKGEEESALQNQRARPGEVKKNCFVESTGLQNQRQGPES
ncbi:hypothetical protein CRG98_029953 [Punica granatum]|uniref:Uncharacterized protein n=1 Tax=Punica granatum TaxID=22663 RepID=A0A2I0J0D4_PUNGR|nr:hypothetical protein CRG98_029953 [Punica granatum]